MKIAQIFSIKKDNLNALSKARREKTGTTKKEAVTCPSCKAEVLKDMLKECLGVCPHCGYYSPLSPKRRLAMLSDEKQVKKHFHPLKTVNPIDFPDYEEKLLENREKTKLSDAIVKEIIKIDGITVAVGVLDGRFLLGSMGTVVDLRNMQERRSFRLLCLVQVAVPGCRRVYFRLCRWLKQQQL